MAGKKFGIYMWLMLLSSVTSISPVAVLKHFHQGPGDLNRQETSPASKDSLYTTTSSPQLPSTLLFKYLPHQQADYIGSQSQDVEEDLIFEPTTRRVRVVQSDSEPPPFRPPVQFHPQNSFQLPLPPYPPGELYDFPRLPPRVSLRPNFNNIPEGWYPPNHQGWFMPDPRFRHPGLLPGPPEYSAQGRHLNVPYPFRVPPGQIPLGGKRFRPSEMRLNRRFGPNSEEYPPVRFRDNPSRHFRPPFSMSPTPLAAPPEPDDPNYGDRLKAATVFGVQMYKLILIVIMLML